MVKLSEQRRLIAAATAEAHLKTDADIVTLVVPMSDHYQSYVFLYGFALGSIAAMACWLAHLTYDFPLLLIIQLAGIAFALLPFIRPLCIKLVPKKILHHRAAHRAYEAYLHASRRHGAEKPVVLFYVSLGERYAHIIPSRTVRGVIPDSEWDAIIKAFTTHMGHGHLTQSCTHAIELIAAALAAHFPAKR